ncbi:DNA adenine methylase [Paenibacillus polymyxa]|uniref:DNA adenine methylase n=1 Tax=Paenibacillus polymyxa TaxID=1406 RepID=UPI0039BC8834
MKSPIKWVGGKGSEIKMFEKYIPEFETYVEPFLGGGALYWQINPEKAILNDINSHLVNFYKTIITNTEKINSILSNFVNNEEFYYNIRDVLNNKKFRDNIEQAAIFYYLNKTGHRGQWRENSKGCYNIPFGHYKNDNFNHIDCMYGNQLKRANIYNTDFKYILDLVKEDNNAFLFLDPPYLECDTLYTADQKFEDIYKYIVYYMHFAKCKVMLVVKNTKYIEKLFKNNIVHRYKKNYKNNVKSTIENEHLVVTNYKLGN